MEKTTYYKRDLIWEATRRNEIYKKSYAEMNEKHPEGNSKRDTWGDSVCYRFRLSGLYDPSIDVDEIKKQIDNGADPKKTHPYYHFFGEEKDSVVRHRVPSEEDTDAPLVDWMKDFMKVTRHRVVVSIDPLHKNPEIIREIKK